MSTEKVTVTEEMVERAARRQFDLDERPKGRDLCYWQRWEEAPSLHDAYRSDARAVLGAALQAESQPSPGERNAFEPGCVLNPKCWRTDCIEFERCVAGSRLIPPEPQPAVSEQAITAGVAEALRLADADVSVERERQGDESPEHFTVRRILEAADAIRTPQSDPQPSIEPGVVERLEALAEKYEAMLAKGEWTAFNSREQVLGWGQGVRAAIAAAKGDPDAS